MWYFEHYTPEIGGNRENLAIQPDSNLGGLSYFEIGVMIQNVEGQRGYNGYGENPSDSSNPVPSTSTYLLGWIARIFFSPLTTEGIKNPWGQQATRGSIAQRT